MADAKPAAEYLFKDHARTVAPDDFWGQVKRTVNGKPVTQDQIDMIVAAMSAALALEAGDALLDLGCGNGALTTYFFRQCSGGLGVDFSDFLIEVANKHFTQRTSERYLCGDAVAFVETTAETPFTKALSYGTFQYFDHANAPRVLRALHDRFPRLRRMVIGNHPNKARIENFYGAGKVPPGIEDRLDSPIGIWRTPEQLGAIAAAAGWAATPHFMPAAYHASHYRFDLILERV